MFLCLSIISALIVFLFPVENISAASVANATISVTTANVRFGPTSKSSLVFTLSMGDRVEAGEVVTITGETYTEWCRVKFAYGTTEYTGYVANCFLTKDAGVADAAFETSIAGFPESYKPSLRSLHAAYPSWGFVPVMVGTNWDTVAYEEARIGRSLIPTYSNDAWKSTDPGAYDWLTNTYISYDEVSWVNATKEVVAFYLDPRNMLGQIYVFQFLNLAYDPAAQTPENLLQTEAVIKQMLEGSFMESTSPGCKKILNLADLPVTYAQTFMDAAAYSGANPYHLVSRVIQETGRVGSHTTSGTEVGYENLYNYFDIGAYSSAEPWKLALVYAKNGVSDPVANATNLIPWNRPYKSIVGGSRWLADRYISKGQYTLYFQKYDVLDDPQYGRYSHQYMTSIMAMTSESTNLRNGYSENGLLSLPLVFSIPVYENMPATAVPQPPKIGNPNNILSSLSVDGYALTPTFDPLVSDGYSLIVPYLTSEINIAATSVATTSVISGAGVRALAEGDNVIQILVTAQNGTVRSYNISVVRNSLSGSDLFTTIYRYNADNTIAGIPPGITASNFLTGFTMINGGTAKMVTAIGTDKSPDAVVASGDRLLVYNAESVLIHDVSILLYGDANGDGKISSSDLTVIVRHVLKKSTITGAGLLAADANHDGKVSSSDLTVIVRHVLKKSTITQ
jgi:beta-N-acetylglucosaminidase